MPILASRMSSSEISGDRILSWTVHLAREHRPKLVTSILLTAALAAAGYFYVGSLGVVATIGLMIASLADFLFPTEYVLTSDGAECRMFLKSSQIRWENVRHCYLDDLGIKLSPLGLNSRLEAFRGVYLRFDGNDQQVIETVKALRQGKCTA